MRCAALTLVLMAMLVPFSGCGTTNQTTGLTDRDIEIVAISGERVLTWRGYDGLGDPSAAIYYLGDRELGQGDEGLRNFARIISLAPVGTQFRIGEYYSPFERPNRSYPMTGNPIWENAYQAARERNIAIIYPTLISQP